MRMFNQNPKKKKKKQSEGKFLPSLSLPKKKVRSIKQTHFTELSS